jgi:hypothetical protein
LPFGESGILNADHVGRTQLGLGATFHRYNQKPPHKGSFENKNPWTLSAASSTLSLLDDDFNFIDDDKLMAICYKSQRPGCDHIVSVMYQNANGHYLHDPMYTPQVLFTEQ